MGAEAIAEVWPASFADHQQSVGQQFPEPPKGRLLLRQAGLRPGARLVPARP